MSSNRLDPGTRVAVVTGGSGGIGGAIVSRLSSSGHRAAVIDRAGGIDEGGRHLNERQTVGANARLVGVA
jgi:NAD(P)-dependent dehydrogenase (short-subunit alcohol dehydrogenase family)